MRDILEGNALEVTQTDRHVLVRLSVKSTLVAHMDIVEDVTLSVVD
jgi:hypothetical protein